ncbi:MAG: rod-binding protein [Gemmatimonadales bacterium]|nr:rod-binding protein [Gemmatimonadales bacterium]
MSDLSVPAGRSGAQLLPAEGKNRLREAARQLEGVFVEQLFKAMRESVPKDGFIDGGTGEEIFTGLLDQHLASAVPGGWDRSLAEALYRQLQSAAPDETPSTTSISVAPRVDP